MTRNRIHPLPFANFRFPIFFLLPSLLLLLSGCGKQVFTGKQEARGIWLTRFDYANERTRNNPEAAKLRIRQTLENARKARLNMVFFQVRGNGDAFYRSSYEPWSKLLTDTLGKDPGWDPLAFAVEESHRLGLELHAWMNTFPIWRGDTWPTPSDPPNPLFAHPEWRVCDKNGKPITADPPNNEYIWASPGIPEVRDYTVMIAVDITSKYDVDGIHFDYIRYPEWANRLGYSNDSVSVARFNSTAGNPHKLAWEHWQREQVNQFVYEAYNAVTAKKPWVQMSASVIGKYSGSGWTAYHAVYQDPRAWMELEKIDFILPMVYWEREHASHPFVPLITEWQDRVAYLRNVLPGLSTNMITKFGFGELSAQIEEVRARKLPGVVFFSSTGLEQSWTQLGVQEFPYWANIPRLMWKDSVSPPPPSNLTGEVRNGAVFLQWQAPSGEEALVYNVYRSSTTPVRTDDVFNLITITARDAGSCLDDHPFNNSQEVFYVVTAVDRCGNESASSAPLRIIRSVGTIQ